MFTSALLHLIYIQMSHVKCHNLRGFQNSPEVCEFMTGVQFSYLDTSISLENVASDLWWIHSFYNNHVYSSFYNNHVDIHRFTIIMLIFIVLQ